MVIKVYTTLFFNGIAGILGSTLLLLVSLGCLLWLLPRDIHRLYRWLALCVTTTVHCLTLVIWLFFDDNSVSIQFCSSLFTTQFFNCSIGVDGVSLFFLILTTFLFPLCVIFGWDHEEGQRLFLLLAVLEFFLVLAFIVLDLFFFCVAFESLIVPMVFLMLLESTQGRRIYALTYLYLYTLIGSFFILLALFILYSEGCSTNYFNLLLSNSAAQLSPVSQRTVWFLLFITFAIKVPIFPFHIWLPEAHVEAPTIGSVILAGLLLKLGGYGIVRFLFLFPEARYFFQPYVMFICLFSAIVASVTAVVQKDMKRIIAYSSIAHMNFALLGYFSNNYYGHIGATCLMLSHAIVSAALFFLIGILYERGHDRNLYNYGGLSLVMPIYTTCLFLFCFSNFSFPGTSNFVGELLVLIGLSQTANFLFLILALVTTYYSLVYSMIFYNQLANGNIVVPRKNLVLYDLVRKEAYILFPLMGLNLFFGLVPTPFILLFSASLVQSVEMFSPFTEETEIAFIPLDHKHLEYFDLPLEAVFEIGL